MAMSTPVSSITLRGGSGVAEQVPAGKGTAILLKLNDSVLQDLKKSAQSKDGPTLVTGDAPVSRVHLMGGLRVS